MNTKRIVFWLGFVVILGLIVWGLIASMGREPGSAASYGAPAPVTAADHAKGPADAAVTVIEYSDFQCPACEAFYPVIERLAASTSTPIRLVYRHFPLPQHANARIAAQASEAAALQGKFWEMYSQLFANHTDWTELADPRAVFAGYAQEIGLDAAKFDADIDSDAVKQTVEQSYQDAQALGLGFTPTFFVNGKALAENPQGYEAFKAIIEAAASRSSK